MNNVAFSKIYFCTASRWPDLVFRKPVPRGRGKKVFKKVLQPECNFCANKCEGILHCPVALVSMRYSAVTHAW